MGVFVTNSPINASNMRGEGKLQVVNRATSCVSIQHLTQRKKREVPNQIVPIKALEWRLLHGLHKLFR